MVQEKIYPMLIIGRDTKQLVCRPLVLHQLHASIRIAGNDQPFAERGNIKTF